MLINNLKLATLSLVSVSNYYLIEIYIPPISKIVGINF